MTDKEKAENYVRSQIKELMELSFGCVVERKWAFNAGENDYCSLGKGQRYVCGGDTWANLYEARDHHAFTVIGHPIQLQHWLRVLISSSETVSIDAGADYIAIIVGEGMNDFAHKVTFNLITGQPETENDYKAFNDIVS